MKQFLTIDEMISIKNIGYSKELSMKERAEKISEIISFDDFMEIWDYYVLCDVLDNRIKDLMLTCHAIYTLFNVWGLFKSSKQEAKKTSIN